MYMYTYISVQSPIPQQSILLLQQSPHLCGLVRGAVEQSTRGEARHTVMAVKIVL